MAERAQKLPDFLIIGAMKAGTTTLYRDLLTNPRVYMPPNKEPNSLCSDNVLTERGRADYAALFRLAKPEQICGEASTAYTKLPDRPGVAERAHKVLGPDVRVIYLVREPVARIISHHHHSFVTGALRPSIDEEVRDSPMLLDYTRYAMQVQPWIDVFGPEAVRIVEFEEYVANRKGVVAELSRFLGIEPAVDGIEEDVAYNMTEGKPTRTRVSRTIRQSRLYRNHIQPYLPFALRDRIRRLLLPKAPSRPDPPSEATVAFIRSALAEEVDRLRVLSGREKPLWEGFERTESAARTVVGG